MGLCVYMCVHIGVCVCTDELFHPYDVCFSNV